MSLPHTTYQAGSLVGRTSETMSGSIVEDVEVIYGRTRDGDPVLKLAGGDNSFRTAFAIGLA